jgi:hypothetical protein
MTHKKISVLFIIFNRPEVAVISFESIRHYRPTRLYIAADGARPDKKGEDILCKKTRNNILSKIDWECDVRTLFRDENVGCGRAVYQAISWMFETEEYGCIIEDDCLVSVDYFKFCEYMLPLYKHEERIAQINCFRPKYVAKTQSDTYYFCTYPAIWGWATWRRAWQNMDFEMKNWHKIRWHVFKRFTFIEAIIHFLVWEKHYREIKRCSNIRAWGFQWSIYVFLQNKLCVSALPNLVINTGIHADATHPYIDREHPQENNQYGHIDFPLIQPSAIEVNEQEERICSSQYIKNFFKVQFALLSQKLKKIY